MTRGFFPNLSKFAKLVLRIGTILSVGTKSVNVQQDYCISSRGGYKLQRAKRTNKKDAASIFRGVNERSSYCMRCRGELKTNALSITSIRYFLVHTTSPMAEIRLIDTPPCSPTEIQSSK
ncbi:hypothetical protein AVEN_66681-1 [Araneus ventricosus]|uniref:Uncharacterized protein n=1 Tax=Araneus ventricosus TaxID=182803 RepID=A0A4Y2SHE2_ARAVE|nr:hypothetical protein AVEN_66681-1 [Araneus ventricosus]